MSAIMVGRATVDITSTERCVSCGGHIMGPGIRCVLTLPVYIGPIHKGNINLWQCAVCAEADKSVEAIRKLYLAPAQPTQARMVIA